MKKNVLITGCSSGIGLFVAQNLQQNKEFRVIASCRKQKDLEMLNNQGFDTILLDLDSSESISNAVESVKKMTNNQLFALINNAGFGVYGSLISVSRAQLEAQFSTNFFGMHELTTKLLPIMIENKLGRIIQISSILGFVSTSGRGAYAASKYALEAWSDALRLEQKENNIFVSLIEPGPISTQFSKNTNQVEQDNIVKNPKIASRFKLAPDAVYDKIFHALTSKKPKIRYRVTLVTKCTKILKRFLPDRLMDFILSSK